MPTQPAKRSLGPNAFLYPLPVFLVATYDAAEKPNVMVAAWGGICSSDPLSLTVSVRPERWTHDALLARKAFTVCVATEDMLAAADYAGIVSGRRHDKFPAAGFTPVRAQTVDAPYIAESPVIVECELTQDIRLGAHTMMIGKILDVKADESCLDPSGRWPDIRKVAPLVFDSGSKGYFAVGRQLGTAFQAGKALLKAND